MRYLLPMLLGAAAGRGGAQSSLATPVPVGDTVRSPHRRPPAIGRNTRAVLITTAGVGATVSLFDSRLSLGARALGGDHIRTSSAIASFVGGPVPIVFGAAMYAVGRGTGNGFTARTGREIVRAVVVSGAIVAVVKGTTGRMRPFAAPGDADEFSPGRGFTNGAFASFPSGHTTAAFATATVLAREVHAARVPWSGAMEAALFGGAAFVGFSRVYQAQHWPSDVIAGATLGTIAGYEVVAHSRGDRSRVGLGPLSHLFVGRSHRDLVVGWTGR